MIRVVKMRRVDAPFVATMIERRWDYTREQSWSVVRDYLSKDSDTVCFVAKDGPIHIGLGAFHVNNDIGVDLHPWCVGLWVDKDYRGRGIGWRITRRRFVYARFLGYTKIYLDTVSAEKYHKKFGWKKLDIEAYNQGSRTVIMEHDL